MVCKNIFVCLLNTQETFFSFTICLLGKKTMLESLATTTKNTDGIKIEKSRFFKQSETNGFFSLSVLRRFLQV